MITILGTTASGKTQLAVQLALAINGEVISADSRQIYMGMDIGSGKDLNEYYPEGYNIPYYLINIREPGYEYNVFEFQKDFIAAYNQIKAKNKIPILCGGTGLYLEAVLKQYELLDVPVDLNLRNELLEKSNKELIKLLASYTSLHNNTDTSERDRLIRAIEIKKFHAEQGGNHEKWTEIKNITFGIHYDRAIIRYRITERLKQRLHNGMIEEVEGLLNQGVSSEQLIKYGLEYKYVTLYLNGNLTYEEMFRLLNIAIHQFAKRQMTWFRRMEKNRLQINWIDGNLPVQEKIKIIKSTFEDLKIQSTYK